MIPALFLLAAAVQAASPGDAVLVPVDPSASAARLDGKPVPVVSGKKGRFVLAGLDLEASTGTARLEVDLSSGTRSLEIAVSSKPFPTKHLKVEDKFVKLSEADERRAEAESETLKAVFARISTAPLMGGGFASPIAGAVSGRFGERRVFNGVPRNPHTGADLRAKAGTRVRAPAGGRVALTGEFFFSGKTVVLDHGLGVYTFYGHLSRVDVAEGRAVRKGDVLGAVGATGRATGPHLHWSARVAGARVDPFSLVALPLADHL